MKDQSDDPSHHNLRSYHGATSRSFTDVKNLCLRLINGSNVTDVSTTQAIFPGPACQNMAGLQLHHSNLLSNYAELVQARSSLVEIIITGTGPQFVPLINKKKMGEGIMPISTEGSGTPTMTETADRLPSLRSRGWRKRKICLCSSS